MGRVRARGRGKLAIAAAVGLLAMQAAAMLVVVGWRVSRGEDLLVPRAGDTVQLADRAVTLAGAVIAGEVSGLPPPPDCQAYLVLDVAIRGADRWGGGAYRADEFSVSAMVTKGFVRRVALPAGEALPAEGVVLPGREVTGRLAFLVPAGEFGLIVRYSGKTGNATWVLRGPAHDRPDAWPGCQSGGP